MRSDLACLVMFVLGASGQSTPPAFLNIKMWLPKLEGWEVDCSENIASKCYGISVPIGTCRKSPLSNRKGSPFYRESGIAYQMAAYFSGTSAKLFGYLDSKCSNPIAKPYLSSANLNPWPELKVFKFPSAVAPCTTWNGTLTSGQKEIRFAAIQVAYSESAVFSIDEALEVASGSDLASAAPSYFNDDAPIFLDYHAWRASTSADSCSDLNDCGAGSLLVLPFDVGCLKAVYFLHLLEILCT